MTETQGEAADIRWPVPRACTCTLDPWTAPLDTLLFVSRRRLRIEAIGPLDTFWILFVGLDLS